MERDVEFRKFDKFLKMFIARDNLKMIFKIYFYI